MPPKKKKGRKKKRNDGELSMNDKYQKSLEEIEILKDHLAIRKQSARHSAEASEEWRRKMTDAQVALEECQETQKAVGADITRQYKTMQTEMKLRIHQLETELARTRSQLDKTEHELKKTREERDRTVREKDVEIDMLSQKINTMCLQYESTFQEYLDRLVDKINTAKKSWHEKSTSLQVMNKRDLLELGWSHLEI